MGFLIIVSTVIIGTEIEYTAVNLTRSPPAVLLPINAVCNLLFFVELVMRMTAKGRDFFYEQDSRAWNCFDLFCVASSILDAGSNLTQASSSNGGGSVSAANGMKFKAAKVARLTRLVRAFRLSRLLRFLRALRTLVLSILSTLKSLAWALLLLLVIFYIFSALLTIGVTEYRINMHESSRTSALSSVGEKNLKNADRYWGTLFTSHYTLFLSLTGGIGWEEPIEILWKVGSIYGVVFLIYIAFSFFAVLNVVTGVFCESAIANAQKDQEAMIHQVEENRRDYSDRLRKLFNKCDDGESGWISYELFAEKLKDDNLLLFFQALEIDVHDAKEFFRLLDTDQGGVVDFEELLMGCMKMKGAAKSLDMMRVMQDTRRLLRKMTDIAEFLDERFGIDDSSSIPRLSSGLKRGLKNSASCESLLERTFGSPARHPRSANECSNMNADDNIPRIRVCFTDDSPGAETHANVFPGGTETTPRQLSRMKI